VQSRAIVKRADIDVNDRGGGAATDHGRAESGVQSDGFMHHGDELGRWRAALLGLGDRFLKEIDLGARDEEEMIDAALFHRRDDGVGPFVGLAGLPEIIRAHFHPLLLLCLLGRAKSSRAHIF